MNCLVELGVIDWNKCTALATWFSNMLILYPMFIYFLVKTLKYIDHWFLDESTTGLTIAIHNKTKSSLFILQAKLVIQGEHTKDIDDLTSNCIKPDEFLKIPIDYVKHGITDAEHVSLHIHFAGKIKDKKIKVK